MGGLSEACAGLAGGGAVAGWSAAKPGAFAPTSATIPRRMPIWFFIVRTRVLSRSREIKNAIYHHPDDRRGDCRSHHKPPERCRTQFFLDRTWNRLAARYHRENEVLPFVDIIEGN